MPKPNPLLRWIVAVLASAWFFPVSCTTALGIGTAVVTAGDARDAAKGDTVHGSIAVVALPPREASAPFQYFILARAMEYVAQDPAISFLMPAKDGQMTFNGSITVSYKVVSGTGNEQTIETAYQDGDRRAWGSYRATRRGITPLTSKLDEVFYLYAAFPFALLFAFAVYYGARYFKRRMQRNAGA